jgi:hypothetical protein
MIYFLSLFLFQLCFYITLSIAEGSWLKIKMLDFIPVIGPFLMVFDYLEGNR